MIEKLSEFLRRRRINLGNFGVVFDIGSRDCRQAIELSQLFPAAQVVAIECNPATLERCRQNIRPHSRITLVERAVNLHTGRCPFFAIDPGRTVTTWADGNPGASSLFVAAGEYPVEKYVQKRIEVDCTRLDDLCRELRIPAIDLIWIDLQGAELLAFESAGSLLEKVRYIYTEVSFRPIYHGQCLFDDVDAFLTARGFRRCTEILPERWQQDVIYENTRTLLDAAIPFAQNQDRQALDVSVRSIRSSVQDIRQVYLVGTEDPAIEGTIFFDERNFPFNHDSLAEAPGDCLRQLIKLYFPVTNTQSLDHVLTIDPGTFVLRPCQFVQGGRPVLNFGDEYHPAHFEHMARLHPMLHRMFAYSGITHCTLLKRSWVQELMAIVQSQHGGSPLWKAYLEAVESTGHSSSSEEEIYFNFCLRFHADEIVVRRLHWAAASRVEDVQVDGLEYVYFNPGHQTDAGQLKQLIADTADKRLDSAVGMRGKERDLRDADDWADYAGRLFNGHRYNKAIEASDRALMLDSSHMLAARHGIRGTRRGRDT